MSAMDIRAIRVRIQRLQAIRSWNGSDCMRRNVIIPCQRPAILILAKLKETIGINIALEFSRIIDLPGVLLMLNPFPGITDGFIISFINKRTISPEIESLATIFDLFSVV